MSPATLVYPASPSNVPASVTAPSAAFKKEVSKVMGAILLFFLVYILMVLLAVGLAIATIYGGIALILAHPMFLTLMIGLGLIGLGIMVFVFMVKFIFAVSKYDHSNSIEITEADHPRLFAFIRQLTKETQTPFPKRIYLSPEVNACVFYDAGFGSMLLPVKKNLQIGLGLVNAVNVSEFKAIMAHEFGHFSQRSMKLGSFVYNVNRVIYNMLFENTGYSASLQGWANISSYFAFFAGLTVKIVQGIQTVLQKMYGLINKNYMSLSREMEFHADAVAASVSGGNNMITALRRVELADSFYRAVLGRCNDMYKEKKIIANLYPNQKAIGRQFATDQQLQMENDLPVIQDDFLKKHQKSRVNFKDQWASHPAITEREQHLNSLKIQADRCTDSAWVLFDNAEHWQLQLTGKIYFQVELPEDIQTLDADAFEKILQQDVTRYSLPGVYNGFYDKRQITVLDVHELSTESAGADTFETIFSDNNASLQNQIAALESDILILQAIAGKQIDTKTFDFDGQKYNRDEASGIAEQLKKEQQALQQQLEAVDKKAYVFFYNQALATSKAGSVKDAYVDHFNLRTQADQYFEHTQTMLENLRPLYIGNLLPGEVEGIIRQLKEVEVTFKEHLRTWLARGAFNDSSQLKVSITKFLDNNYAYFSNQEFFNNELDELHIIGSESWQQINNLQFAQFKSLLEMQMQFIQPSNH